jgi:hypothetical protein
MAVTSIHQGTRKGREAASCPAPYTFGIAFPIQEDPMKSRPALTALCFIAALSGPNAAEPGQNTRADAVTWPLSAASEPDVRLVTEPDSQQRSDHADAITWECPLERALMN